MTYLILNLFFLLAIVLFLPKKLSTPSKKWWLTLVVVIALTAVFDPIIIGLGIVEYNPERILGLRLFGAPIEDFFYALFAVAIVPLVWHKIGERRNA